MTSKPTKTYSWSAAREGNLGYVVEKCVVEGNPDHEYSYERTFEMVYSTVLPFIEGRRRVVAMQEDLQGNFYVKTVERKH